MEALAALSLVCNILQLIDEGTKLATACREFSKYGASHEIQTLEALDKLSTDASESWKQALQSSSSSDIDRQIERCAHRCTAAVTALHLTIRDVRYKDGSSVERKPIRKAWKARQSVPKIEEQKKTFAEVQMLLQTTLLTAIRKEIQDNGDADTKHRISMDKDIQELLNGNRTGGTAVRDALMAIQDVQAQVRRLEDAGEVRMQTLVNKLDVVQLDGQWREAVWRLMQALKFDDMFEREDEIKARVNEYGETAKWIFGEFPRFTNSSSIREEALRDVHARFDKWLRESTGIWFIEGKPGSGKSSLMRFIRDNLQEDGNAHHLLSEWARGASTTVLSFFFFRPAPSKLAKSFEGLWRSLCVQILDHDPSLLSGVVNDHNAPQSLQRALSKDQILPVTLRKEALETWFFYLLRSTRSNVLILLDGLDEFQEFEGGDEGHESLLEKVQSIDKNYPHVKLICSARPDKPFKHALRQGPYFQLQEVNFPDIAKSTIATLRGTAAFFLAQEIISRADGVFLWAHVVANDLAKAAKANASPSKLEERLDHFPRRMNELFSFLIARQDDFYRKNPQPILWLYHRAHQAFPYARSFPKPQSPMLSLFELLLLAYADYSLEKLMHLLQNDFSAALVARLTSHAQGFDEEVIDRSGGLLRIVDAKKSKRRLKTSEALGRAESPHEYLWKLFDMEVRFVHRTAMDFLREDGASFLATAQLSDATSALLLAVASIGILGLATKSSMSDVPGSADYQLRPTVADYIEMALIDAESSAQCQQTFDLVTHVMKKNATLNNSAFMLGNNPWIYSTDYPHCCDLPPILRLQSSIARTRGSIVNALVVPCIETLDKDIRPLAAAYLFQRLFLDKRVPLIKENSFLCSLRKLRRMSSPFTELSIWLHLGGRDNPVLYLNTGPLWRHFFTYGVFGLLDHAEARSTANHYFEEGVDGNELCSRLLRRNYAEKIAFEPYLCESRDRSSKLVNPRLKGVDCYIAEGTANDLPEAPLWQLASKATRYNPTGLDVWLDVSDAAAKDFVLDLAWKETAYEGGLWELVNWPEILRTSLDVVNGQLDQLSAESLESLRQRGWVFSDGHFCHHPDQSRCKQCGFDVEDIPLEMDAKWVAYSDSEVEDV